MNYTVHLMNLINSKGGIIMTTDVSDAKIPREYIKRFINNGTLEKVDRGAYIAPDVFDDEMYRIQKRYKKTIYSHDTALFFHELTDRDPIAYTVTVPSGYNSNNIKQNGLCVFNIKRELFEVGLTEVKTTFGRMVKMYDAERSICDCIRSRNKMDIAVVTDAIKMYVNKKDKNIPKLMSYADMFGVSKILQGYLEVLL